MGTILAAAVGLCIWLIMWSLDVKALDAFLVTLLILIVAATMRILLPFVPGKRRG